MLPMLFGSITAAETFDRKDRIRLVCRIFEKNTDLIAVC